MTACVFQYIVVPREAALIAQGEQYPPDVMSPPPPPLTRHRTIKIYITHQRCINDPIPQSPPVSAITEVTEAIAGAFITR